MFGKQRGRLLLLREPRLLEEPGDSEGPMLRALASQSTALTTLVAHLAGGTDALQDLAGGGTSHLSFSGRGIAKREKTARSSNFFLQVQQQLYKRMNPARQAPRTQAELTASGASMTAYLERYGGYDPVSEMLLLGSEVSPSLPPGLEKGHHSTTKNRFGHRNGRRCTLSLQNLLTLIA